MALHTWFEGVDRGQHRRASWTHDYFLREVRGWAWRAPIDADITSVGVVASRARYQAGDLGLDINDMRGRLAAKGLVYMTQADWKART